MKFNNYVQHNLDDTAKLLTSSTAHFIDDIDAANIVVQIQLDSLDLEIAEKNYKHAAYFIQGGYIFLAITIKHFTQIELKKLWDELS